MIPDRRPISERISVLARQAEARAIGSRKRAGASIQDAQNADREASWLNEASAALKEIGK